MMRIFKNAAELLVPPRRRKYGLIPSLLFLAMIR